MTVPVHFCTFSAYTLAISSKLQLLLVCIENSCPVLLQYHHPIPGSCMCCALTSPYRCLCVRHINVWNIPIDIIQEILDQIFPLCLNVQQLPFCFIPSWYSFWSKSECSGASAKYRLVCQLHQGVSISNRRGISPRQNEASHIWSFSFT